MKVTPDNYKIKVSRRELDYDKKTYKTLLANKPSYLINILKVDRNRQIKNLVNLLSYKVTKLQKIVFGTVILVNFKEGYMKLLKKFKVENI